jgi:inorganic pyrophosphatase
MEPLTCFVEIPRGSRNKYEYDEATGRMVLDRFISASVVYPTDYGFLLETLAEDGDPLDALVCVSEPTFPGCTIHVRPVAVLEMEDEKGPDEKILCVPEDDPAWIHVVELEDVSTQLRREIAHFFSMYKDLDAGREAWVKGWAGRAAALEAIEASRQRYRERTRA